MNPYRHWSVRRDDDRIAWITLDVAESPMNKLSAAVMAELGMLLDDLDRYPPAAAVFLSGKEAGFVAGADIEEFTRLDSPEKARELVARGWDLFNRLAAHRLPDLRADSRALPGRRTRTGAGVPLPRGGR